MQFCHYATRLLPLSIPVLLATCFIPPAQARDVYNFDPGWRLKVTDPEDAAQARYDDSTWKAVTLPRAWNEDDAFAKNVGDLSVGVAWYRKHFSLPASAAGKKVFVEFEGARQAAEVYVNGKRVGLNESGINAFGFDITEALVPGENVIAVRTDNRWDYQEKSSGQVFQWGVEKRFNANYGGLPKNVRLHVMDKLYQTLPLYSSLGTTGVYVYARDFDIPGRSATIHAESEVRNEYPQARTFTYEVQLKDADGKQVASIASRPQTLAPGATTTVQASAKVAGLNFWSWGYGYLYDVVTTLKVDGQPVDSVTTRTGFRKTDFSNGMVRLNDRAIQTHGYAQRTTNEWPAVGNAVPAWLSDYSNGLALASNANLIRWMHVTPWKQDVESLDRLGLMEAMPAGDQEFDPKGRQWEQRVAVMRDSIIYNRNNPSIVFYEAGNHGISAAHMREMRALRDKYDPYGGRASGSREMLSTDLQKVAEYGGEMLYINKSAHNPLWAMEYQRDEGLRKYWDELTPPYHKDGVGPKYKGGSAASDNRNQDTFAIQSVKQWYEYYQQRPGTGARVNAGGVSIMLSDSNTFTRSAENFRSSGKVDAMRIPKDAFFVHQIIWDGWVDVERPRAYILGHWNYPAGTVKPVNVVASSDSVELFLNGKSLGKGKKSDGFLFTFDAVRWQPGELKAVGYDAAGKQVCEAALDTVGAPVALKLTPIVSPQGLRADGADLALVQVEVVDAKGQRNPVALNQVHFDVQGPAEWRGGIALGPNNYVLARTLPVEGGVNRVFLRTTTEAGKIAVHATADGLAPAELTLESKPATSPGGLSSQLPGEGLALHLERGPTPATASFKASRVSVPVRSVEASSNAGDASRSVDDDETTAWESAASDPHPAITYHLAHAATLSEITMRLTGWRSRSYPLRITIDGEEVFRGQTARSSGYATVQLKPHQGTDVRIELLGTAQDRDENKLIEVANQKNTDTGADKTSRDALSIVEADFYQLP